MDDTGASAHGAGDTVSTRSGPAAPGRRAGQGLLYAIPTVGVVLAGWAHRNLAEDAFIYLRVVKQLEAGHGPVFNIGQRVEAFTGTIWLFALSLADAVTPARLEWIAVTLGIAVHRRRRAPGDARRPAPVVARRRSPGALVRPGGCAGVRGPAAGVGVRERRARERARLPVARAVSLDPGPVGVRAGSAAAARARPWSSGSAGSCDPSSSSTARCSSGWSCGASRRTARGCASPSPCWPCPSRTRCSAWATSAA